MQLIRKISATLVIILIGLTSWAQGWRTGEMEVNVMIGNIADAQKVRSLGLEFEPAATDGSSVRMYLVPEEFKVLKNSNLRYQITIPDLNKHFEHYWDNTIVPPGYYTYDQIIALVDSLAANFPSICKKVSWGTSIGGRQLAALKISDNVNTDEPEAEIMFDGGIHGDEVGGSQNVIMFARDLCLGFGSNPTITNLVNNREIWLYPMVNPDGRASMSRYNVNGVDCNRDNGYMWNSEGNSWGAFSQVETKALRNGILDNQFVVYTNFHSGTEILSFPWSYRADPTRDNEHINQLADVYANASGYSNLQYGQGYNIMYAINGSTKDFQYGSLGNIGWSMEISLDKQPPASQIGYYYNANKPAMLEIINQCAWGVSGMITDSVTGEPVRASIWVNNYFPVYTDPLVGDYHKYLVPGTYTLKVVANGYQPKTIMNVVVASQGTTVNDIQLKPAANHYAYKVMSCQIPGNNFGDEGYTPGAIGAPDGVPYSLGKNGWIVLDMGDTIYNGPGADFKVIQAGATNKGYTVSGGNNIDGPFTTIGTGNGTTSFELGATPLSKMRYLYIKDSGSGASYGVGMGFNLDAVEMLTPPLIVNFNASNTVPCQGTTVNFTDISSGNPTQWNWSFPGGTPTSSNLQNPANIRYDSPGIYNATLSVSNGYASGSKIKTGYINVASVPLVSLGSDTTLCPWNSILLDAGNPGMNYLWSTGATSQTIFVDSTGIGYGTRNFSVNVTNLSGCPTADSIQITFETCTGMQETQNQPGVVIYPNPATNQLFIEIDGFQHGSWQLISMEGVILKKSEVTQEHDRSLVDVREIPGGVYFLKIEKEGQFLVKKIIIIARH
jgi:PKD repeat protein